MNIFKKKQAAGFVVRDGKGELPGELNTAQKNAVAEITAGMPGCALATGNAGIGMAPLAGLPPEDLAASLRPKTPINPAKVLEAARAMKKDAGQITFYIYDRGQCFDNGAEAVLAMVNMNGCAAHYMINSRDKTWAFFQMPHLNTEKRACFRMGYRSIDAMHEHLFEMFNQHLAKIGWNERHTPVVLAV